MSMQNRTWALLGALALAGLLGACASTTATAPGGESLTLMKPMDQTLRRGETNKVAVYVRRDRFAGPVKLTIDQLPGGLDVVERDLRAEAGKDFTEFTLHAKPDADLVGGHAVRVTASGGDALTAVEWFHVTVKPQ
jgi:hypothetical protein